MGIVEYIVSRKKKIVCLCFFSILFLFLLIFFIQINPLILFDADDWTYTSYTRLAIPLWKDWNPCRIYPEIFMSFCSNLGLFFIKPFLNSYIDSLSVAYGMVVSVFVIIYIFRLTKLINSLFTVFGKDVMIISILFLLLHFWSFRNWYTDNDYFFYSKNTTCYFYYVIPNLHNASLVLYFAEDISRLKMSYYENKWKLGMILLLLYLGIFSNLFPTIILISFFSYFLLLAVIRSIKEKTFSWKKMLSENFISLISLLLWSVSLVFEAMGGRSESFEDKSFDIIETFKLLWVKVNYCCNRFCLVFFVIVSILIIGVFFLKKEKRNHVFFKDIGCFTYCVLLCTVFEILLCTKTDYSNIQRTDILFSPVFYIFVIIVLAVAFLLKQYKSINIILPVLLLIIFTSAFNGNKTFLNSNQLNLEYKTCKQLNEYLIQQIVESDEKHLEEMTLKTPVYTNQEDNWPHAVYFGDRISKTLYQHGVISRPIQITISPSKEVNDLFGLDTVFERKIYR